MARRFSLLAWSTAATAVIAAGAIAQTQQLSAVTTVTDPTQLPDQEIGRSNSVKPEDLPPPYTKPIVASRPLTVPHAGQEPRVPQGFTVTLFASGLAHPRRLLVLPNGDVILAEPGAVIGFAGQRVIKQTIGQDLPEGFQTAEFLLEKGQIDDVVPRASLRETTARLLRHMQGTRVKASSNTAA